MTEGTGNNGKQVLVTGDKGVKVTHIPLSYSFYCISAARNGLSVQSLLGVGGGSGEGEVV